LSNVAASGAPLGFELDAREALQGLAVVQRVLQRLVGQGVPLLKKVGAQHPL
jgi:hypothetical protein